MPEPIKTFTTRVRGLWKPRHTVQNADGKTLGVLEVTRNRWGMVVAGEYRPERGEVLSFRRDPGLLRAQFSVWTDGREWLGSSLRWRVGRRRIDVWTGAKPYRVVPLRGLEKGWRIVATKTGEVARIRAPLWGRSSKLELYRKMDFELLLFCYFLGSMTLSESIAPTALEVEERARDQAATASGA